jgi:hypothetical protein
MTPALVLLDGEGRVKQSWFGAMSQREKSDARKVLGVRKVFSATVTEAQDASEGSVMSASQVAAFIRRTGAVVVDIRSREEYARGHIDNSRSMPVDEMRVRAIHELPIDGPTIVYCGVCQFCETGSDERRLNSVCDIGFRQLTDRGFSGVRILRDDILDLERAGLAVVLGHPEATVAVAPLQPN